MTSEERREGRYQRRKAKRTAKAQAAGGGTFEQVMSFGNLCRAGKDCCRGSRWKTSTINFETDLLSECLEIHSSLVNGTRKFTGFHSFTTIEHGKARNIDALPIQERTLQKCLCQNLLTHAYSRSFIYDNSASLQGKGMDFAIRRLEKHLHDHYRRYGLEGGIYQFDFKSYFGSIPHDGIKARARERIRDDRLYDLFCSLVDDFQRMGTADRTAEIKRGVGLGSEVSQIIALDYASPIDHYIRDRRRAESSARYMDDGYVISPSLDELKDISRCIHILAEDLGLQLSDKKDIITPFRHHSFTFLKMRFTLQESGKVTIKLSRKGIRAIRRKLAIFRRWVDTGKMSAEDAFQSYQSWRAHAKRCDSYRTLEAMDALFVRTFAPELAVRKKKFPCTLRAKRTSGGWTYTRQSAGGRNGTWNTSYTTDSKASQLPESA